MDTSGKDTHTYAHVGSCKTTAHVERLCFDWEIEHFSVLRRCAKIRALPNKDRLTSSAFGSESAGYWHLTLFPNGSGQSEENSDWVSLYLYCDTREQRLAEFAFTVLSESGTELAETTLYQDFTSFSTDVQSWGWTEYLYLSKDAEISRFTHKDTLRLRVTMQVMTSVTNQQSLDLALQDRVNKEKGQDLAGDFKELMLTTNLSDITLICGHHTFSANRIVLAARSKVFRAMLYGDFKEADKSEIEIDDVPADVMTNLLEFAMTDDCHILRCAHDAIEAVIALFETADKFKMGTLFNACAKTLIDNLNPMTVLSIFDVAERHFCDEMVEAATAYLRNTNKFDEIAKLFFSYRKENENTN